MQKLCFLCLLLLTRSSEKNDKKIWDKKITSLAFAKCNALRSVVLW